MYSTSCSEEKNEPVGWNTMLWSPSGTELVIGSKFLRSLLSFVELSLKTFDFHFI